MGFIVHIYRGALLLLSLLLPSRRKHTLERWKRSRFDKLLYELGSGVIGVAVIGAILVFIVGAILNHR